MAPRVAPLAQSESKARFFARLGLNPTDRVHKRVYTLMKLEAAEGRRRLLEGQAGSTAQIHEAAWSREVLRIYEGARTETKAVYEFGHDIERDVPDNWIIRWLLWHVFRYRDYRNKNRPPRSPNSPPEDSSSEDDQPPPPPPGGSGSSGKGSRSHGGASTDPQTGSSSTTSGQYWDPIREQWQAGRG